MSEPITFKMMEEAYKRAQLSCPEDRLHFHYALCGHMESCMYVIGSTFCQLTSRTNCSDCKELNKKENND